ncbi:MAG: hypothetical protein JJE27_06820, partial [Thermoleophilia bacterium]|nr:hypothetical protein [Thermoleophilia bacterium]
GQAITGRVDQFDSGDDTQTPGGGAAVGGGGATATSGADGLFTISFATPGHYLISATKSGVVRGSAWIDVSAAPAALPAIAPVRVNRFAKCAARYGKGSPKHRRCIRIVRGKQRAECRGADARVTAHCQKVLARFKGRRR